MSIDTLSNQEVESTRTESHGCFLIGERYLQPFLSKLQKMRKSFRSANKNLLLKLCVKVMKDRLKPEILIPSSLLFGEYPKVFTPSETPRLRPTTEKIVSMRNPDHSLIQFHKSKSSVTRAPSRIVPTSADTHYHPGAKFLVWRESVVRNRIGEWMGLLTELNMDFTKKLTYIRDVKSVSPVS